MTGYDDDCGGELKKDVVLTPDLTITIEADDNKGDYIKLISCSDEASPLGAAEEKEECAPPARRSVVWYWIKMVLLFLFLGFLAVAVLKWVGPYFIDKEVIPIINWETETFSLPVLTILVFASVALFPTILLPSTPSMWVAGMKYGYGFGFLLIIPAVAIGVSFPFIIGSIFHHKIEGWLEKYPKKASILKSAGGGSWFHQFRAVALIRVSPFPYMIYNYCAVATNVKYGPYIIGSLVGIVPEIFVALYTLPIMMMVLIAEMPEWSPMETSLPSSTRSAFDFASCWWFCIAFVAHLGILIRTLADATNERQSLSAPQIIFNALGFCLTVATTIIITVYAKRRLKELQEEDNAIIVQ